MRGCNGKKVFKGRMEKQVFFVLILFLFSFACFKSTADEQLARYWVLRKKSGKVILRSVEIIPKGDDTYEMRQWFRGSAWFTGEYKLDGNKFTCIKQKLVKLPFYKGFKAAWIVSGNKKMMKADNQRKAGDKRPTYDDNYLVVKRFKPSSTGYTKDMAGPWTISWTNMKGKKYQAQVTLSIMEPYVLDGKSYIRYMIKPSVFEGVYIVSGKNLIRVSGAENSQSGAGWGYVSPGKYKIGGKTIYKNAVLEKVK